MSRVRKSSSSAPHGPSASSDASAYVVHHIKLGSRQQILGEATHYVLSQLGPDTDTDGDLARLRRYVRRTALDRSGTWTMEADDHQYRERIVTDASGRFGGIRREYQDSRLRGCSFITTERTVASQWANARSAHEAQRRADAAVTREMRGVTWRRVSRKGRRPGKRAFDIIGSALGLLFIAPLIPLVMLLIRLEDGRPVFFVHKRQTVGGRAFGCLKFRIMRRDAEQLREQIRSRNRSDGPQFHIPDDPRLLRIGRILRRWNIDELPQLLNVLKGDMSFVGPRPSPEEENQCCPAWREARLSVRPGITGLWQVCRTREPHKDFQEWIRFDMDYVRRQSWRLDLWVLLLTPLVIVKRAMATGTHRRR